MAIRLSDEYKRQLDVFQERSVEKLSRKEYGTVGFAAFDSTLIEIRSQFNQLSRILEFNQTIRPVYYDAFFYYLTEFNSITDKMLEYTPGGLSHDIKLEIVNELEGFLEYMRTGTPYRGANYSKMPFITLSLLLKQLSNDDITGHLLQLRIAKKILIC